MTRIVRRPSEAAHDGRKRLTELRAALDTEGVAPGELFAVEKIEVEADGLGPYSKDSDTSRYAALDNYPRAGSQRRRVIDALRDRPATRDELSERLELLDSAVDARVWELLRGEWIYETVLTRPTRAGSAAHVLALTDKGAHYRELKDGAQ